MNSILRALALVLVATGAAASSHITRSAEPAISAKASFMPIPMCPPDGTTDCGMCQTFHNCVR